MTTSIFIARLLGVLYLTVGLGMLLQRQYYRQMLESMMNTPALLYFGGAMALGAGVVIITFHNIWDASWVVLITLLGWAALIKGVALLVFPQTAVKWSRLFARSDNALLPAVVIALIFGLIFAYYGFLA